MELFIYTTVICKQLVNSFIINFILCYMFHSFLTGVADFAGNSYICNIFLGLDYNQSSLFTSCVRHFKSCSNTELFKSKRHSFIEMYNAFALKVLKA